MLITKRFVYIHIPKTGGDFLRSLFETHFADEIIHRKWARKHAGDADIPPDFAHLPRLAHIRNPWDWHVSWYHYCMGSGRPDPHRERIRTQNRMFVRVSRDLTLDFPTTMWNLYGPAGDAYQPDAKGFFTQIARDDVDVLTIHHDRCVGESLRSRPDQTFVGRFENLQDDTLSFFTRFDIPTSDQFVAELRTRPARNTSARGAYVDYYDDRLQELIGRKARLVIDRYGYRFASAARAS